MHHVTVLIAESRERGQHLLVSCGHHRHEEVANGHHVVTGHGSRGGADGGNV